MSWTEYLPAAILRQKPNARPGIDFNWSVTDEGPAMTRWNDDVMGGPFVLADWEARAIAEAVASAEARINSAHELHLERVSGGYSRAERDTWPVKAAAAFAFLGDTASPAQIEYLEIEAAEMGETTHALATRIVTKYDALARLAAKLSGIRRKALAALVDSNTPGACHTIVEEALAAFAAVLGSS
jgi:hypothetical protein